MKLIIILSLLINAIYAKSVKILADKDYSPYTYNENKVQKGIYIELINKAFSKIPEYEVEYVPVSWKKSLQLVELGKNIAFIPPFFVKERLNWLSYSEPLINETILVFAKDSINKGRKNFPEDFYELTVCMHRGYDLIGMGGKKFSQAIKNKRITLIEANTGNDCLNRVKRNIADFHISDRLIDISKFSDIKKGLKIKSNFGYMGFSLRKDKYPHLDDLKDKFNTVIRAMQKSGEIEQIVNDYLSDLNEIEQ
jgi:polar amino acid transport system substrate-binding protein